MLYISSQGIYALPALPANHMRDKDNKQDKINNSETQERQIQRNTKMKIQDRNYLPVRKLTKPGDLFCVLKKYC